MDKILDRYGELLAEVDAWYLSCFDRHSARIACRRGCSACCRGLFDITLLDAAYLRRGFDRLNGPLQESVAQEALRRLESLTQINPCFAEPWLLNGIPETDWDELMPEDDETPCLMLSENGECLVYEHRPMTCRLNGIPLIDVSGEEFFDEWCTLNFTAEDPRIYSDLRFAFADLFSRELLMFQEFTEHLSGRPQNEVDLFIPAALIMDLRGIATVI